MSRWPRWGRVTALVRQELALAFSGRGGWRLPGLAALMLVPLAALRTPAAAPPPPPSPDDTPRVAGQVPPGTEGLLVLDPAASVRVEGPPPWTVHAATVPGPVRSALDRLGEPRVQLLERSPEPHAPLRPRALAIVLLAVSFLTGPLAETLPGERSQKTFDVLLSASVTPLEVALGKWAAWTLAATVATGGSLLAGLVTGAQAPGWYWLQLPMAVGTAVALGLFLVRRANDVVTGATLPLRVLPVVAMTAFGGAWALAESPPLAALVPWGGALLVVVGRIDGAGPSLLALGSEALLVGLLLTRTARDMADLDTPEERRRSRLATGMTAVALTTLAALGPSVWDLAGRGDLGLRPGAATTLAALVLLGVGLVAVGRERAPSLALTPGALAEGLLVGAGLALVDRYAPAFQGLLASRWADSFHLSAVPWWALVAGVLGSELVFRHALLDRGSRLWSVLLWAALCPTDPLTALASGAGLVAVVSRRGWTAALVARLGWVLVLRALD